MDTIGLDLHKSESQLCILAENGAVKERRLVTSRERLHHKHRGLTESPCQVIRAAFEEGCVIRLAVRVFGGGNVAVAPRQRTLALHSGLTLEFND